MNLGMNLGVMNVGITSFGVSAMRRFMFKRNDTPVIVLVKQCPIIGLIGSNASRIDLYKFVDKERLLQIIYNICFASFANCETPY